MYIYWLDAVAGFIENERSLIVHEAWWLPLVSASRLVIFREPLVKFTVVTSMDFLYGRSFSISAMSSSLSYKAILFSNTGIIAKCEWSRWLCHLLTVCCLYIKSFPSALRDPNIRFSFRLVSIWEIQRWVSFRLVSIPYPRSMIWPIYSKMITYLSP